MLVSEIDSVLSCFESSCWRVARGALADCSRDFDCRGNGLLVELSSISSACKSSLTVPFDKASVREGGLTLRRFRDMCTTSADTADGSSTVQRKICARAREAADSSTKFEVGVYEPGRGEGKGSDITTYLDCVPRHLSCSEWK
jgi:hypothetical protein